MRIALVNLTAATGHHGGYASTIINTLVHHGHDAIIMGSSEWCSTQNNIVEKIVIQGASVEGGSYLKRNREYRKFIVSVFDFCNKNSIDIVHFIYIDGMIDALRKVYVPPNLKVLATLHWYPFLSVSLKSPKNLVKGYLTLNWCGHVIRRGGSFVVHSNMAVELIKKKTGSTQFSLDYPNFNKSAAFNFIHRINLRSELGLKLDDHLFLCFGGTRHDKGVDIAVRALAGTLQQCHLLIAGASQFFDESTLKKLALEFGVNERVHFKLQHIEEEEISGIFSAADTVLLPYRRIFTGQSGPLIIAADIGRPVIAADVPVLKETVLRFNLGKTFVAENTSSLAEVMNQSLKGISYGSRNHFSRYLEPTYFAKKMIEIYENLYNRK